jgi:hypothetical protein
MNQEMNPLYILVGAILVFIIITAQIRRNQKNISDVQAGRRSLDDREIWLANTPPTEATVVSKKVVISPKARTIAKVDLELNIRQAGGETAVRKTTWLVEVPSLPELEEGRIVRVKVHPKKPERIFPAEAWARAWLFGNPGKNKT